MREVDLWEKIEPIYYRESPSPIGQLLLSNSRFPEECHSIECIEFIEKYRLGFCLGNAYKYVYRCGNKCDAVIDLNKALWYLNRHFESGVVVDASANDMFRRLKSEIQIAIRRD
jgi:hypothetical protein